MKFSVKNLKKVLFIITLIFACISFFGIFETYAKYVKNIDGGANLKIAKWNIYVNNNLVLNNTSLENKIRPTFSGTEHIKAGIIAPTSEGYFDLLIDYSEVDVSFDYEILVEGAEDCSVIDMKPVRYSVNGGFEENFAEDNKILGECLKTDNVKTKTVRVFIKWDDENGEMDNASDTNAAIAGVDAELNVKMKFIQKVL